MHVRREFLKAEESEPEKVKEALELMRPLWKVEKEIREQGLEGEAKRLYRIEHSKPLVDAFFKWVDEQQNSGLFLPKNPFSKALQYAHKREEMLKDHCEYLDMKSNPGHGTVFETLHGVTQIKQDA